MKKIFSAFVVVALFAACKGKEQMLAVKNASNCLCDFYTGIDRLELKKQAAANKEEAAIAQELKTLYNTMPKCMSDYHAERDKGTQTQYQEFEKMLFKKMLKKCPKLVKYHFK